MTDLHVVPEVEMSPILHQGVKDLLFASFDSATFFDVSDIVTPVFRVLGVTRRQTVVAHVAAYERGVTIGGKPGRIAMLGDVAVAATHRRQGMTRRMIEEAHRRFRRQSIAFCVLFAYQPEIYRSSGYEEMTNETRFLDRGGTWKTLVYRGGMVCALSDRPWTNELLDLKGITV